MREGVGETGGRGHLDEDIGDPHLGQAGIKVEHERVGLGCSVVQDRRSPVLARKRHRHDVRQFALARAVELFEEGHGAVQALAGGGSVELEGLQECRRVPAKLHIALGRQRQGVLRRQISQRGDLLARRHQAVPADLLVEHVERVPLVFAGAHHRVDGAAEQPDQPTGLRLAGRPRAVLAIPRPREQPAGQTLEQGDRRIGQRRYPAPASARPTKRSAAACRSL